MLFFPLDSRLRGNDAWGERGNDLCQVGMAVRKRRPGHTPLALLAPLSPSERGCRRLRLLVHALRNAGDAMKAMRGMVMLAMADVIRAVSLVVKWAMAPPMVQPIGIMPWRWYIGS